MKRYDTVTTLIVAGVCQLILNNVKDGAISIEEGIAILENLRTKYRY
jgi:hypothetical protein